MPCVEMKITKAHNTTEGDEVGVFFLSIMIINEEGGKK